MFVVASDDLGQSEAEVGAQQEDLAVVGMHDGDKADEANPAQGDALLVLDRAQLRRQGPGETIAQPDFSSVKFGQAAARAPGEGRHGMDADVFLGPGNQVAALVEQSGDDFTAGLVRIGHQ